MNEVSKCAKINCPSLDNLYFPLKDVNIGIWVLKATVHKIFVKQFSNAYVAVMYVVCIYHCHVVWCDLYHNTIINNDVIINILIPLTE